MNRSVWTLGFLLAVSGFVFTACETSEDDKMGSAQSCMDKAVQANVQDCINILDGVAGTNAEMLRCGAYFIRGGLDSNAFKNAFGSLKDSTKTGGGTASSAMMQFLIMTDPSNTANVATLAQRTELKNSCSNSGLSSMQTLGNFANLATTVASVVPGGLTNADTPEEMKTALENFVANGGDDATLGSTARSMAEGTCSGSNPPDYCAEVNSATTKCTTDADIGTCVRLKQAKQTTGLPTCCQ